MPVHRLNLVVSGLFDSFQAEEIDLKTFPKPGLLQKTLGKSDKVQAESFSICEYQKLFPLAYYHAAAQSVDLSSEEQVLYADPVYLQLHSDHLKALPAPITDSSFNLSELVTILNQHFQPDDLHFLLTTDNRLLCHSSKRKQVKMHSLAAVIGRDIKHFLPEGDDASFWRRVFNEIQMLFHQHTEALSQAQFNALWFWGGGQIEDLPASEYLIGESTWITGYQKTHNQQINQLKDLKSEESALQDIDNIVLIDESLVHTSSQGDFQGWLEQLSIFERDVFTPCLSLLYTGQVKEVYICRSSTQGYLLKPSHRYRLFRSAHSIKDIALGAS